MRLKLFSIIFAVISGLYITSTTLAKPPFEVPAKGGLPQCKSDLGACETNLNTCGNDLTGCTMELGICTSDLGFCNGDLETCSTDLGLCTSELGNCNAELGTCGADLITCTQNLDQTSYDLNICESGLLHCKENAVLLPATGQTTCWTEDGGMIDCDVEAGEDGYFEAGGGLAYIWNNDGTLMDVNTKLMWERKDMSGGIHDVRDEYTWINSFRQHIHTLNNTCKNDETVTCSANGDADCVAVLGDGEVCGFAGYRDWRVPNVKEMQSIIDYSQNYPPVPLAFKWLCGDGCSIMGETGCSCTHEGYYWTSTTFIAEPNRAWFVDNAGQVKYEYGQFSSIPGIDVFKNTALSVRAVRGGL